MKYACSIVKSGVLVLLLATALIIISKRAFAQTVTFDNLSPVIQQPSSYEGYNWTDFGVISPSYYGITSWAPGVVSPNNVAFEWDSGAPSTITSANPFGLTDGFFTAAYGATNTVTALGYVNGIQKYTTSFTEASTAPVQEYFNWSNLSSVSFTSSQGQFIVDNLTLNPVSTPEPQSPLAILLGLGVVSVCIIRARKSLIETAS